MIVWLGPGAESPLFNNSLGTSPSTVLSQLCSCSDQLNAPRLEWTSHWTSRDAPQIPLFGHRQITHLWESSNPLQTGTSSIASIDCWKWSSMSRMTAWGTASVSRDSIWNLSGAWDLRLRWFSLPAPRSAISRVSLVCVCRTSQYLLS